MMKGYRRVSWKLLPGNAAWLFFVIGASGHFAPARAGDSSAETAASSAQNADSSTQSSETALSQVVVTAQRFEQRAQDVPITIAALSGADLTRQNVMTTYDLPSVVSGLVWSNEGAWVMPSLRGVSTNVAAIGGSSPIAIYLDGVYLPMEAGSLVDLPDVSRIEVLKGPQGTLFGRNATGGAISVYTLDPSFTPTGTVNVSAGLLGGGSSRNSGRYNLSGFVSGPLVGDTLAGSISAYADHIDGYLTNDVNGQRAGRVDAQLVRGKLLWKPADGANIIATAYYSHREDGVAMAGYPFDGLTAASFYPGAIVPTQPWHYAYDGSTPNVLSDQRGGSLKGTFDLGLGTLTSITGYADYDILALGTSHAAYSPACVAVFACVVANIPMHHEAWSQEFDFASKQIGRVQFVAGLYGFYWDAREHDGYNNGVFTDTTEIKDKSYAAFGQATYSATDNLSIIAGVRVTRDTLNAKGSYSGAPLLPYADKSWTSTTPRASLVYRLNPVFNTYFTYSAGFKAGVVSGQYTIAPPANPEKLSAFEVGVKADQPRYLLNLAAFYYDYRDLQVETLIDQGVITVPQNAARAEVTGLDFEGALKWTDAFQTRLTTTYLARAEYSSFPNAIAYVPPLGPFGLVTDGNYDATGTRMLVAPLWTGTLSATYTRVLTAGVLEGTASLYYSSAYRWVYTGAVQTAGYNLLNARLTFSPASSRFRYSLYGKNLTNKAYIDGVTPNPTAAVSFFGHPREVGVAVQYSF